MESVVNAVMVEHKNTHEVSDMEGIQNTGQREGEDPVVPTAAGHGPIITQSPMQGFLQGVHSVGYEKQLVGQSVGHVVMIKWFCITGAKTGAHLLCSQWT